MYQFKENFTLPEFKAIRDITRSILSSGSVIVNQISKELNEQSLGEIIADFRTAQKIVDEAEAIYNNHRLHAALNYKTTDEEYFSSHVNKV